MRSTFVRQMTQITLLLLLTLSVLGAVFNLGVTNYLAEQKQQTLSGNARAVAVLHFVLPQLLQAYPSLTDLDSVLTSAEGFFKQLLLT